jgi:hypothetical protein
MIEWYPGSDCKAVMTRNVSRRELLRSGTSAASILILGVQSIAPGSAAASLALDQFMSISTKLTGQPSLDGDMGQKILDAFEAAGQGGNIATLFEDATPERNQTGIANAIVAAWYSGISPLPGAREVTGFNEALVWNALSYTKPWGSCGGETGYWADPPAEQEP